MKGEKTGKSRLITEKQVKFFYAKAKKDYSLNNQEIQDFLEEVGYKDAKDIPFNEFDDILGALADYAKNKGSKA